MEKLDLDKYFLNKEQSLKLKDLGFNEPCIFYFVSSDQNFGNITHSNNEGAYVKTARDNTGTPRPSYDQAFDWFAEKGYSSYIDRNDYTFRYNIDKGNSILGLQGFETHTQAKIKCMETLIAILENEKV